MSDSSEPVAAPGQPPLPKSPPPEETPAAAEEPTKDSAEEEEEAEPAEGGNDDGEDEGDEEGKDEAEGEKEEEDGVAGVHKGKDGWTAVWSADANAYYYWNANTQEVTWENPLAGGASANAEASTSSKPADGGDGRSAVDYGGIDPELAYLDPNLARAAGAGGSAPVFQARFNSRTGRFQGDPSMNPDRISDFSRAERQQNAYYDVGGWNESLEGRGIKRAGEETDGRKAKKPTAKQVEQWKQKKVEKQKRALSWLKE
ncbi:WW/Rsp5/WWP domain containing protein [Pseudohyphozyma bogoriensis]|nr:WW/Rsp5/WWP domain containing protein [Pseudohyphozyma bogoriensis]